MSCKYTAQGNFICITGERSGLGERSGKESFVVNDTPNEHVQASSMPATSTAGVANNCQQINTDFMAVSARHNCSATANIDSCAFSFICKK